MSRPDFSALDSSLQAFTAGRLGGTELAQRWREAATAWPDLPPRYRAVLEQLLLPLESSALFAEESCSFSQADLATGLADWLAHARQLAA